MNKLVELRKWLDQSIRAVAWLLNIPIKKNIPAPYRVKANLGRVRSGEKISDDILSIRNKLYRSE
jgi:hypothetical protein